MQPLFNNQVQIMLAPQAVTSDGTNTSGVIDMLGYDAAQIILSAASSTTTAVPVAIAIQHADTTDSTNFATILSAGTASTGWKTQVTNATTVSSVTAAWAIFNLVWGADRKRYLRCTITGPTANSLTAAVFVNKARASITPTGTNISGTYISTSVGSTYVAQS